MSVRLKNGLYLLNFSILIGLMASCLGGGSDFDEYSLADAELLSFSLSSDSVPGLGSVVFSIDQHGDGQVGLVVVHHDYFFAFRFHTLYPFLMLTHGTSIT